MLRVFKFRQLLGLENPKIDHPLMTSPLGKHPDEVGFMPDELIARVRSRMAQEGYDEQGLIAECCQY